MDLLELGKVIFLIGGGQDLVAVSLKEGFNILISVQDKS